MQQKFALVASAVIVGLAVLAGLRMSQENLHQANLNTVTEDLLIIAGRAQAWYRVPADLGGGGGAFSRLTLAAIHLDSINGNGSFALCHLRRESFRVTGTGAGESLLRITLEVFPDSIKFVQVSQ